MTDKTICEDCGEWVDCDSTGTPWNHTCAPSLPAVTVEVKPLVWHFFDVSHEYGAGVHDANGLGHTYTIQDCADSPAVGPRYYVREISASFAELQDAKDAVFDFHRARILAALEPVTVGVKPLTSETGHFAEATVRLVKTLQRHGLTVGAGQSDSDELDFCVTVYHGKELLGCASLHEDRTWSCYMTVGETVFNCVSTPWHSLPEGMDAALAALEPATPVTQRAIQIADEVFDFFEKKGADAEAFGAAEVGARLLQAALEPAALTPTPVDDRKPTNAAIKLAALPQERQDKIKAEADRLAALDDLARLGQEFDAAPATYLHANKNGVLDDDLYGLLAAPDPAAIREGDYFEGIEEGIKIGREAALREAAQAAHDATTHPSAYACKAAILALIPKGAAE